MNWKRQAYCPNLLTFGSENEHEMWTVTKIMKAIETIVMDTCVTAKYGCEGLNGTLKKMLFRSTRTWRKRAEVCYWLKSSWRHDIWWFPLQWHHLTLKNGSSATLLQLNNILGREQYQFRGIFEDKKVGLLYRLIKIDSILSHPVKVSSRSPALSGQLRCKLKEHLVYI